jgi:DNA-binding MarR family transcriptional regulator
MASLTLQTVHGIIGNLERAGLIARSAHPVHGRVRMIALSKSGRILLARCKERAVKADAELSTGISPAEELVIRRWLIGLATRAQ